ncbi:3-keto-disaccharide hydrolase [Flagellimonas sp.]|uniref:3-keto-disaccharide hydrolase n=1 Tax=Flagellimonas sp. TaxID=2058762 RepID=UPI003B5C3ED0
MLRNINLFLFFSYLTVCVSPCIGQNQIPEKEGFVTLFNGENLDGWIGNKKSYQAIEGNIVVNPNGGGSGGNLFTEAQYSDFIFKFEFQLTPGANNGLGIHAPLEGDVAYVGKELQILDNTAEKYSELKAYQYHGSVYGVIPAKRGFLRPVGQWNEQIVTVQGSKIKVVLNGNTIVDGDFLEASKNGTMDKNNHPGLQRTVGHIGFLGHGDVVRFRNIKIKELASKK